MALDPAAAYAEARDSLVGLLRGCSPQELLTSVPATPLWSATDVVRHLCGVARDVADGTLLTDLDPTEAWHTPVGAAAGDAFTASHVDRRRALDIDAVIDEWDDVTERLLPILRGEAAPPQPFPFVEVVPVSDLAVHLQDVRGALQRPGDRESAAVGVALASYAYGLDLRLRRRGLPALRIRYAARERVVGEGEPVATWAGERYEVFRALAARRSRRQIAAMEWDGDAAPFLSVIPAYGERADDLAE